MDNKPKLIIYEEQIFNVGEDTFIESTAENDNAVVFEGNGETGYFYVLDRSKVSVLEFYILPTVCPSNFANHLTKN